MDGNLAGYSPKGPRTKILGFEGPSTIILRVFGPYSPLMGSLDA